jgi:hypothetical protein
MNQDIAHLQPSAIQLSDYTEGQVLPPISVVEFRPGNGRGRPPKGHEAIVATTIEQVQEVLRGKTWARYRQIVVRFQGDCHHYSARVESVFGRPMLVIEDLGIVTSA